jgi:MSHA pilin protein MshD
MGDHGLCEMSNRSVNLLLLRTRGATLVELIVSIVVISIALVGVLIVINRYVYSSADPMYQQQALAIAESFVEEIQTKSFVVGPGATRPTFDDIFDYNNLANNGCAVAPPPPGCPAANSCVCNQDGTPMPGLQGYVVNVQVTIAALGNITAASGDAALIQVTVTPPVTNTPVTVSGYRTNYY